MKFVATKAQSLCLVLLCMPRLEGEDMELGLDTRTGSGAGKPYVGTHCTKEELGGRFKTGERRTKDQPWDGDWDWDLIVTAFPAPAPLPLPLPDISL